LISFYFTGFFHAIAVVNQVVLEPNNTDDKHDDEIKEKSIEMLDKLTNALLNSTNGRMIH